MSLISFLKRKARGLLTKHVTAEVSYLQPDARLSGKRILITGGSSGLGYAMAAKFISEGAKVIITGRNAGKLQAAASTLGCPCIVSDVSDVSAHEALLKEAEAELGGLDTLVSNAGISLHEGDMMKVSPEDFDMQFDINLKGGYFLAQKFISRLRASGTKKAAILFMSSERGEYVDDLPYGLTKNALNALVKGLAKRVGKEGIRVNAVAPGVTATEMTGFDKDGNLYVDYNTNERVYLPEEVAEVACFLLSDASACLSGQILVCNEGKSINAHWR